MFTFLKQERKHAERIILLRDNKKEEQRSREISAAASGGNSHPGGNHQSSNSNRSCLVHPNGTHFTRKCRNFLAKSVQDRGQLVKDKQACALCLSINHINQPCPFAETWQKCDVAGCNKPHSRLVHGCTIQGIGCHAAANVVFSLACQINETLLLFEYIKTANGSRIVAFWDNGSTLSLVTKEFATRNKLRGVPILYDLETVGGKVTTQNTWLYEITIVDRQNNSHVIKAFQIDEICSNLKRINTDKFAHLFPSTSPSDIRRPKGKVELLVGNNYAGLHPSKKCVSEGLVIYETMFGTGKILGGSHNQIKETSTINQSAHQCASARVSNIRVHQDLLKPALDFITTEGFGVQVPEKCPKCKGCKDCKFEAHQLSREEQRELDIIRENLTLDPIEQVGQHPTVANMILTSFRTINFKLLP